MRLYAAHDALWFLPRYKIWFCDWDLAGRIMIVRFDPRRGCIEGYQLVAFNPDQSFQHWQDETQVMIHAFQPRVMLHLDKPLLHLDPGDRDRYRHLQFGRRRDANRFADEIPLRLGDHGDGMFTNFSLARALDHDEAEARLSAPYSDRNVWPTSAVPAQQHVASLRDSMGQTRLRKEDSPHCRAEVCDQAFRLRSWVELGGSPALPGLALAEMPGLAPLSAASVRGPTPQYYGAPYELSPSVPHVEIHEASIRGGLRMGEEICTYSTLDPALYTPTAKKPWRGIWVGDYSGHGCEFLLMHQPDEEGDENGGDTNAVDTPTGRLDCIKLTGDPNVPRGEYSFLADDVGPRGLVRTATKAPFEGARIVKSKGHVAQTGFQDGKYFLLMQGPFDNY